MAQSAAMFGSHQPSNGCVLLVEDDMRTRQVLREALQGAGYDVIEAEDAGKGIEAINVGENPLVVDTVITDIDMDKGMDVVSYFKQNYPHVPLIVLTGLMERPKSAGQRTKIAILGAGRGGSTLLEMFSRLPEVEIVGIMDKDPFAPALARARERGIPVVDDAMSLIARGDTHLLVDVTGDEKMEQLIAERKSQTTEVLGGEAAKLLWTLVQYETQMQRQLGQSQKVAGLIKDGVTDYLVKPIAREKLLAAVGNAMDRREISKL